METCLKTINLRKRMFYISPRSILAHTWIIDERKTKKFYLYLFIKLLFLLLWSRNAKANTWSVLVSIFRNDPYNLFLWNVNDVTECLHKKNVRMNGFWSDANKDLFLSLKCVFRSGLISCIFNGFYNWNFCNVRNNLENCKTGISNISSNAKWSYLIISNDYKKIYL